MCVGNQEPLNGKLFVKVEKYTQTCRGNIFICMACYSDVVMKGCSPRAKRSGNAFRNVISRRAVRFYRNMFAWCQYTKAIWDDFIYHKAERTSIRKASRSINEHNAATGIKWMRFFFNCPTMIDINFIMLNIKFLHQNSKTELTDSGKNSLPYHIPLLCQRIMEILFCSQNSFPTFSKNATQKIYKFFIYPRI